MMDELRSLFEPIVISGVELTNRIVMAPMTLGLTARDGSVSQREIDYYAERAKGGVGLIITGIATVDYPVGSVGGLVADRDCYIPGLRKLADAVHSYGAKVTLQLNHVGRYLFSRASSVQPVAPSAVPSGLPAPAPRALTTEEVEGLIEKFARAAARAQQAGLDGIEVHAASGYLVSTFLSPLTNKRTDRFGGDTTEARFTFLGEIIQRVRETVGDHFIIGVKLSVDQFMSGGVTIEDSKVIARLSEEAGASMFNASHGWHEAPVPSTIAAVPRGAFVYLAEALKEVVSVPVGVSSRINEPRLAARIIGEKRADLVLLGRPLMTDPYFPKKAEEGDLDDIRMCIACNRCLDQIFGGLMGAVEGEHPIICSVNAELGREGEKRTVPVAAPKKVLVVGGGAAGMEAARVAALRGHKVTLWEAKGRLGGALMPGAAAPHKQEINNLIAFLSHQTRKLGVSVQLSKEATPEDVVGERADEVIVATGGLPMIPEIPGLGGKNVVTAVEALTGEEEAGEEVVIIGGGMVGCETAEFLAGKGKKSDYCGDIAEDRRGRGYYQPGATQRKD